MLFEMASNTTIKHTDYDVLRGTDNFEIIRNFRNRITMSQQNILFRIEITIGEKRSVSSF